MGAIKPGYDFGRMPKNASCGYTGVYINRRHFPAVELQAYASFLGQIKPGRYWMDVNGKWGPQQQAKQSTGRRKAQGSAHQQYGNQGGADPRLVDIFKGEYVYSVKGIICDSQIIWALQADGFVFLGR